MAKYEKWIEPDGLTLLRGWARDGLTNEQIAKKIGISRQTLQGWCVKYKDISDTLKKGREVVDYEVEDTLLAEARKGNVTAMIFWLKNRRPDRWRDKPKDGSGEEAISRAAELLGGIKSVIS